MRVIAFLKSFFFNRFVQHAFVIYTGKRLAIIKNQASFGKVSFYERRKSYVDV